MDINVQEIIHVLHNHVLGFSDPPPFCDNVIHGWSQSIGALIPSNWDHEVCAQFRTVELNEISKRFIVWATINKKCWQQKGIFVSINFGRKDGIFCQKWQMGNFTPLFILFYSFNKDFLSTDLILFPQSIIKVISLHYCSKKEYA